MCEQHQPRRIKHRVGENSIKMYDNDKPCPRALDPGDGNLRIETTINDVDDFKHVLGLDPRNLPGSREQA